MFSICLVCACAKRKIAFGHFLALNLPIIGIFLIIQVPSDANHIKIFLKCSQSRICNVVQNWSQIQQHGHWNVHFVISYNLKFPCSKSEKGGSVSLSNPIIKIYNKECMHTFGYYLAIFFGDLELNSSNPNHRQHLP